MDIKFTTETETNIVHYVYLEGVKYNYDELLELLSEIKSGDTIVTNKEMGEHLLKIGVIDRLGSQRSCSTADLTQKGEELLKQLYDNYPSYR
jgi:hypothetical protein